MSVDANSDEPSRSADRQGPLATWQSPRKEEDYKHKLQSEDLASRHTRVLSHFWLTSNPDLA